ncbi:OST6 [Candida jiufengensis]|uniref:OST6 n=1 Tax=Candida jiufengensis TaxID=497108 RepID=UPI00222524CB|nr:OST6 [Candida jiufengensis]KAI5952609.1 OST6 [Candida jiufengensis]
MKIISVVTLLLFSLTHSLANNYDQLDETISISENNIIQIHNGDLSIIDSFKPRPFYTLLYLTSSNPKHECQLCAVLGPMIHKLSQVWYKENYIYNKDLVFVEANLKDFSNAKIFNHLKLTTIPHIWLIPPQFNESSTSILDDTHYQLNPPPLSEDKQILALNEFLNEQLSKQIKLPQSSSGDQAFSTFFKTFLITFSVIVLIKKKGPSFLTSTKKKTVISIISILFVILCTSGYQFTLQNKVPLLTKNKDDNSLIFISGGTHYQYAVEIAIVSLNYLSLFIFFISLIKLGDYKITDTSMIKNEKLRIWFIILNSLIIYILISCLTSIILRKDGNYPYAFTVLF